MSVNFTLTSKTRVDQFKDSLSIGDVVKYAIDTTPWQEDNDTVTSATWTNTGGSVAIASQLVSAGIVSAVLTPNQSGTQLIEILLQTASGLKKKIWLQLKVKDIQYSGDDYGLNEG